MRETAEAALDGLKANATVESPAPILSSEQIPVRRTVGDWLLMRSGGSVRRRLFGPSERPDAEIDVAMKEMRLGEPARDAIRDATRTQLDSMIDKLTELLPEQLVRGYAERFEVDIAERLEAARAAADERLERLGQRLRVMQQANDRLRTLDDHPGPVRGDVETLMERFAQTDPATVTQQAEQVEHAEQTDPEQE